ncbi:MAG: hypothetical protein K8W52_27250, partial [Deltaproteobacteria bacterium]|nr:hypothetical protein [Deltaproteobacteria bacterium]
GGAVLAAAHGPDAVWLLVKGAHGAVVEKHGAKDETFAPPAGGWQFLWTDRRGRVAIAAPTGEVAVLVDGAWQALAIDPALPAPRPGPGAAHSAP